MDTNEVVVAVIRDEPLRRSKEEVKGRLVFGGHRRNCQIRPSEADFLSI